MDPRGTDRAVMLTVRYLSAARHAVPSTRRWKNGLTRECERVVEVPRLCYPRQLDSPQLPIFWAPGERKQRDSDSRVHCAPRMREFRTSFEEFIILYDTYDHSGFRYFAWFGSMILLKSLDCGFSCIYVWSLKFELWKMYETHVIYRNI